MKLVSRNNGYENWIMPNSFYKGVSPLLPTMDLKVVWILEVLTLRMGQILRCHLFFSTIQELQVILPLKSTSLWTKTSVTAVNWLCQFTWQSLWAAVSIGVVMTVVVVQRKDRNAVKWVRPERTSFLMSSVLGSQSTLQQYTYLSLCNKHKGVAPEVRSLVQTLLA